MNEFDQLANGWDENPLHMERSEAVAASIRKIIPLKNSMKAMEYGAGTGILSFLLKDQLSEITLIDNSEGMLDVLKEKIARTGSSNLRPLRLDLEKGSLGERYDLVFNQMVLHHVEDVAAIMKKFHELLRPGGFLAIADLYPEDGSFHGEGFTGHTGFDPEQLSTQLADAGFIHIRVEPCFIIKRKTENGDIAEYPIFLLTARR